MSEKLDVVIEVRTAGMYFKRQDTCEMQFTVYDRESAKEMIRQALDGLLTAEINDTYIREHCVMIEVSPGYESVSAIGNIIEAALGQAELRL